MHVLQESQQQWSEAQRLTGEASEQVNIHVLCCSTRILL
jgi:hypothetical protein